MRDDPSAGFAPTKPLLRRRAFNGASIVVFTLSGSIFAMLLYLALYLQNILGLSPLAADDQAGCGVTCGSGSQCGCGWTTLRVAPAGVEPELVREQLV